MEKRYLLLLRWISFHGILSNSIQSPPRVKTSVLRLPFRLSTSPFLFHPLRIYPELLSLSLSLFLNSLWRKLLICFIANGGCPGETWGKGFLVPHSGSDGLQTTPVLTVVGNMCNGIPCRTSTYTYDEDNGWVCWSEQESSVRMCNPIRFSNPIFPRDLFFWKAPSGPRPWFPSIRAMHKL